MKYIILIVIFIAGLIIIHLMGKIKELENETQFLARLLFENELEEEAHFYELKEDEEGTITDKSGRRFKMIKVKVDNKK